MRFYLGFSKKIHIKTIIQLLGFLFVGLCAFFGIDKLTAHAATFSASGYDVHAYRCDTYDTDSYGSGLDYCAPEVSNTLYNATGCNNVTIDNNTYCMFQNSNSTSYFSTFNYRTNGSAFGVQSGYNTNTGYRPHSKLVWRWKQSAFANLCPNSTSMTLTFHVILQANNSLMGSNVWATGSKLCADNLNTLTGSIGSCDMNVYVNSQKYSAVQYSYGNSTGNYNVTITKPTTDVEFEVPKIQPFLPTLASEGGSWSNATFNYGIRISAYECGSTNTTNQDVINAIQGSSSAIINNDNNNTSSINSNITNNSNAIINEINDSASNIVDSIDDLKDNQNNNTQEIIDSQKVCSNYDVKYLIDQTGWQYNKAMKYTSINGTWAAQNQSNWAITDYIKGNSYQQLYNISNANNIGVCFYDTNKSFITCKKITELTLNTLYNAPENTAYIRFSLPSNLNIVYFQVKSCKNGNQSIYDYISDSTVPDDIELNTDLVDSIENNNTLQQLAMYPINLLNLIVDSRDSSGVVDENSCQTLSLDLSPITRRWGNYDYTLTIPCLGLKAKELIGDTWFNIFDVLLASLLFYFYVCHLVEFIDLFTDGVDMFPGFFTNHIKQQYVDDKTGEVSYR